MLEVMKECGKVQSQKGRNVGRKVGKEGRKKRTKKKEEKRKKRRNEGYFLLLSPCFP